MEFTEKEKQEIIRFLSIFGLVPNDDLTYLKKDDIIVSVRTKNKDIQEAYDRNNFTGLAFIPTVIQTETVLIMKNGDELGIEVITPNKKSYKDYYVDFTKYSKRYPLSPATIEEISDLVIEEGKKELIFKYNTTGENIFTIEDNNNILVKGFIDGIEYPRNKWLKKEYSSKESDDFYNSFYENLLSYNNYYLEEASVAARYIYRHISNAYNYIKENPEKYQKRLDRYEHDIITDFNNDIEKITKQRDIKQKRLIRQRKYLAELNKNNK